jgi:hypothetical protein
MPFNKNSFEGGYSMVFQLGLSASLLAGRIAESPLTQLPRRPLMVFRAVHLMASLR